MEDTEDMVGMVGTEDMGATVRLLEVATIEDMAQVLMAAPRLVAEDMVALLLADMEIDMATVVVAAVAVEVVMKRFLCWFEI